MKKNVWIFNHYATNMRDNKGGRHYWFADNLHKKGYQPTIFCSNQYHFEGNDSINLEKNKYKVDNSGVFPFVFVKSSPYKGNGLSRVLNMCTFYKNLFSASKIYAKQSPKPDVIIASSPHPLAMVAGIKIARKYKVHCICEVRDLWPESIFAYGKLKKNSILGKLLQKGEKWIYNRANKIIFTMPGAYSYIVEQGWQNIIPKEKCFYINNGVDLEMFDYNKENYKIDDKDLHDDSVFKIIYTGSVRLVNDLRTIVDVARELKENEKLKFLIWGDGDKLEELREYVRSEKLTNIIFKGGVAKKYVPYINANANACHYHGGTAAILRFGGSQNKNFEYLASGKPILNTIKMNYDFILENNAGIGVETESIADIKKACLDLYNIFTEQKELYDEMCRNARKTAEEFDFKVLTDKLIGVIEG